MHISLGEDGNHMKREEQEYQHECSRVYASTNEAEEETKDAF